MKRYEDLDRPGPDVFPDVFVVCDYCEEPNFPFNLLRVETVGGKEKLACCDCVWRHMEPPPRGRSQHNEEQP